MSMMARQQVNPGTSGVQTARAASILLVDDEPQVTHTLERLLRIDGYRITCANSAEMAMDILATERMDVVIADERMPGQSGSEFMAEVRVRFPSTLRIMLSGRASLESAVRAINEGEVFRFLLKPCRSEELREAVRLGLQHRRLVEQNRWLLQEYKRRTETLQEMDVTARVMQLKVDEDGAILLNEAHEEDEQDVDELISEIERELFRSR
jgi:two-component system, probable response regulator PhcQ